MDSSSTFQLDAIIKSRRCLLNSLTAPENSHHGSDSLTHGFSQILGISFRNSLYLFSPKYCPKLGLLMMVGQVLGSAPGVSMLSFDHSSAPLQLKPAAAIVMPIPNKNSFSVNRRILVPLSFSLHS